MKSPLLDQIWAQPLTSLIVVLNSGLYLYLNLSRTKAESVSFNYVSVTYPKLEIWRFFSSSFAHFGLLHILFNMGTIWSYGFIESLFGWVFYLKVTFLFIILSNILQIIGFFLLKKIASRNLSSWLSNDRFGESYVHNLHAVGYSCVAFGWMTFSCLLIPNGSTDILGIIRLPLWITPFLALLITQFMVPRASFMVIIPLICCFFSSNSYFYEKKMIRGIYVELFQLSYWQVECFFGSLI